MHTQLGFTLAQYFAGCQDKRTGRGEILSFGVGGLNPCQDTAKLELLGGVKSYTQVLSSRNEIFTKKRPQVTFTFDSLFMSSCFPSLALPRSGYEGCYFRSSQSLGCFNPNL